MRGKTTGKVIVTRITLLIRVWREGRKKKQAELRRRSSEQQAKCRSIKIVMTTYAEFLYAIVNTVKIDLRFFYVRVGPFFYVCKMAELDPT